MNRLDSYLQGPVKISIEDPVEAGWKRYFVKISGTEKLEAAETSSMQLKIPSTSRLKIFVEASEVSNLGIRFHLRSQDSLQASLNNRKRERSDFETDVLQSHSNSSAAGPRGSEPRMPMRLTLLGFKICCQSVKVMRCSRKTKTRSSPTRIVSRFGILQQNFAHSISTSRRPHR